MRYVEIYHEELDFCRICDMLDLKSCRAEVAVSLPIPSTGGCTLGDRRQNLTCFCGSSQSVWNNVAGQQRFTDNRCQVNILAKPGDYNSRGLVFPRRARRERRQLQQLGDVEQAA